MSTASPYKRYEQHPIGKILPPMTKEEYANLKKDISTNGQREPIMLCDDQILDGWHRYRVCGEVAKTPTFHPEQWKGDPVAYVMSANLHRRHLTPSQRTIVAAELPKFNHGGDRSKPSNGDLTVKQRADLLGVSEKSVERGDIVVKNCPPEVIDAIKQGKVKVSAVAETLATKTPEQQKAIINSQAGKGDKIAKAVKTIIKSRPAPAKTEGGKQTQKPHVLYHAKQEEMMDLLRQFTSIEHAEEYAGKTKIRLDETLASMRKEIEEKKKAEMKPAA